MFVPQHHKFEIGDGTEVFAYNAPDNQWRIRFRDLVPRIVGTADLSCLGHRVDGKVHVTGVGLFMPSRPTLPETWQNKTFSSAQELERVVRQELAGQQPELTPAI